MKFEFLIKKSLSDVPDIPSGLFEKVRKRVHSKRKTFGLYYAIAASLLLLLGSLSIIIHKPDTAIKEEVADELQLLHDYVNGDDLDNDMEMYAIINNY